LQSLESLYLNNNNLTGLVPSFLQSPPYYEGFNISYNYFSCPLPTYCSTPIGDGLCAPCVNQSVN